MARGVAIVAVAATLAVSACGGGTSKSAFLEEGNAICNDIQQAAYAVDYSQVLVPPTSPEATRADLARFARALEKTIDVYRRGLGRLRALMPPDDFRASYARALAALGRSLARLDEAARAARQGRRRLVREALSEGGALTARADAVLAGYGLTTCRF